MMRFVQNLFDMASEVDNISAVGFSFDGTALELRSAELLSQTLPKYFKHNKVSSFIRQLNNYGFKRIVPPRSSRIMQSYCHPSFQRDRADLLKGIRRPSTLEDAHHNHHIMRSPRNSIADDEAHFSSPEKKPRSDSEVERELEDALMMIKVLGESNHQLQRQNAELQHRLNDHEVAALLFSVASSSAAASASASSMLMDDYDSEYDADEDRRFRSHSITERRSSLEEVRFLLESNGAARSLASSNTASPTNLFCFE